MPLLLFSLIIFPDPEVPVGGIWKGDRWTVPDLRCRRVGRHGLMLGHGSGAESINSTGNEVISVLGT